VLLRHTHCSFMLPLLLIAAILRQADCGPFMSTQVLHDRKLRVCPTHSRSTCTAAAALVAHSSISFRAISGMARRVADIRADDSAISWPRLDRRRLPSDYELFISSASVATSCGGDDAGRRRDDVRAMLRCCCGRRAAPLTP